MLSCGFLSFVNEVCDVGGGEGGRSAHPCVPVLGRWPPGLGALEVPCLFLASDAVAALLGLGWVVGDLLLDLGGEVEEVLALQSGSVKSAIERALLQDLLAYRLEGSLYLVVWNCGV